MKSLVRIGATALLVAATVASFGQTQPRPTGVVTASNAATNTLLLYSTSNKLVQSIPTGGQGGASGNSGGIAYSHNVLAVVNFGSKNVSIFDATPVGFRLVGLIPTQSSPLSVAFGHGHLYVLGTASIESHPIDNATVATAIDGWSPLVLGDGSAAQVGVLTAQLILTEKNNAIETVNLSPAGAVTGTTKLVANIPANVNAPFGLVTRQNEAYVTIAHANEISLVRNDAVLTVTGSGTQSAPCWLTLDGAFLYSSNSPSKTVSRYVVYAQNIIQDAAVAATFGGDPTDIDYRHGLLAVIDGTGSVSHLSIFNVDEDGNLSAPTVSNLPATANGVVVVQEDNW